MPNRIEPRIASLVAAVVVAIVFGAHAASASVPAGVGDVVVPLLAPPTAKPTHRPKATPTPIPTPTRAPTPPPTRQPTPAPTAAPTRTPTPQATKPPAKATAKPAATKAPAKTPTPTRTPKASGKPKVTASASARPSSKALGAGPIGPTGGGNDEARTSSGLAENDVFIAGILLFTLCSAGAAALYAFGRRQSSRHVEFAPIPAAVVEPRVAGGPSGYETSTTLDDSTTPDEEAGVPRWLRASLRAERAWTPERRNAEPHLIARYAAETFTDVPSDSVRMTVGHDDVNVLDAPNDSYAAIVTRLRTGDEVLVVRMDAAWAEVRTPRGATGWLHTTMLTGQEGDPAASPPDDASSQSGDRRPAKRSRNGGGKRRTPPPS